MAENQQDQDAGEYPDSASELARYLAYPISRTCSAEYALSEVLSAIQSHEQGSFAQSARLADNMMRDPVVSGLLKSRVRAALSATFSVAPSTSSNLGALADLAAAEVEGFLPRLMAHGVLESMLSSMLLLGFGISQVVWDEQDRPLLDVWEPGDVTVRWLPTTGYSWSTQSTSGPIEIDDVDARWCIAIPGGRSRGWFDGMVRSLGEPWIQAHFAVRDWLRCSERMGMPILKALVPSSARAEDKQSFAFGLAGMGSSGLAMLPQGVDEANSFGLELLEMSGTPSATFKGLLDDAHSKIAKRILGTDSEQQPGGLGSGAADSGENQRIAIARGDAAALAGAIQEQVLRPWAYWKYGDADLAPKLEVSLETPAEKEAQARLMLAGAQALKGLQDAGVAVDIETYARKIGVPLAANKPTAAKEFFAYHLEYGIPTVNEVRGTLGLAPREGGDEPTKPPVLPGAGGPFGMSDAVVSAEDPAGELDAPAVLGVPVASTEAAKPSEPPTYQARRARAAAALDYADKTIAATRSELTKAVKSDVDMLMRELSSAADAGDAKAKLLTFYKSADASAIEAKLRDAGELMDLVGAHSQRDEGVE